MNTQQPSWQVKWQTVICALSLETSVSPVWCLAAWPRFQLFFSAFCSGQCLNGLYRQTSCWCSFPCIKLNCDDFPLNVSINLLNSHPSPFSSLLVLGRCHGSGPGIQPCVGGFKKKKSCEMWERLKEKLWWSFLMCTSSKTSHNSGAEQANLQASSHAVCMTLLSRS